MAGDNGITLVLRSPGVLRTAGPYALARIGIGMELLALLLFVHDRTGTFVQAGLVNAAFAVGAALAAPVLGRAVDRRGQHGVLTLSAVVHLLAVAGVVAGAGRLPGLSVAAAALAGASLPPLSSCMRVLWPTLVPESLRGAAYSIESLLVEGAELLGPALVGAVVFTSGPATALLLAAVLVGIGTLAFATSPVSSDWRTQRLAPRPRGLLLSAGPLRVRSVRLLVAVVFVTTAGLAALEVALARFASGNGSTALTGPLLGAMITGSLLGAWVYGRRPRQSPAPDQVVLLLGASAVLSLAPLLAVGLWSMAALLLLTGALLAPTTSALFLLMTDVAPEDSRTESFTWASTASFLGVAVGTGIAGTVVSHGGSTGGVLLSTGFAVLGLVLGLRLRAVVRPAAVLPRTVHPEDHDEVVRERDEALAALRAYGVRCDEMARELAVLKQERRDAALAAVGPQTRPRLRSVETDADDVPRRTLGA